ncbi:MAG: deoxyribose-phosphate aldolase [Treponema sp.]|jgi:deoxyribose-phosphate aldolase|nr:deoxyribose-phosphate aldolase [Treponema sp.]
MNVNDIVRQTNAELERLIGGTAAAPGPDFGGILNSAPARAAPASIGPVPSSAPRQAAHGQGIYSAAPGKLEHSLLDPGISREKIVKECELAGQYGVANVVVSPYFVECAADILKRTGVAVCSVAGFPHGAASQAAKSAELRECIRRGATEMDIAINILAIKSGETDAARRDLQEILQIARGRCMIKAIYEQSLYNDEEKKTVLSLIRECSCDFVKISNALSGKKAEEADLQFVRGIVGTKVGIKIDGGVKTLERALQLFQAGADRIGLSATIAVAKEALESRTK